MIKSDFHVHTSFSTDATDSAESTVLKAIEKELDMLCITDHMDIHWPYNHNEFIFDTDEYLTELNRLKKKYSDSIKLLSGVELGLRNEPEEVDFITSEANRLGSLPFDFIIGSTHIVDNGDPYYDDFWEGHSVTERIRDYYEATYFNASHYDDFDVYGHLDYIVRYIPEDSHIEQTRFLDITEAILKTLITKGKGIEINTKAYYSNNGNLNPSDMILSFYKSLGGEIITVGSDSHCAKHLTDGFDVASIALKKAGFKYYTVFENRKPTFIEL